MWFIYYYYWRFYFYVLNAFTSSSHLFIYIFCKKKHHGCISLNMHVIRKRLSTEKSATPPQNSQNGKVVLQWIDDEMTLIFPFSASLLGIKCPNLLNYDCFLNKIQSWKWDWEERWSIVKWCKVCLNPTLLLQHDERKS